MTMNGVGSLYVCASTVTWRSSIASSSADCVFGDARLISSASTTLANTAARPELEVVAGTVPDRRAGHVRRQEVGRELDAPPRAADRLGDGLGERRLADAGHVLDQEVTLGEQTHEREVDRAPLALEHQFDLAGERVERVLERRLRPGSDVHR